MTNDDLLKFASENDAVMKMMAELAMEQAATYFATKAMDFANNMPSNVTGQMALVAFAAAIESSNAKVWPKGSPQ